ncbi:pyridoxal 5'-phosphate synthase glutaminase subunit PdxT [Dehalogenimonas etheniformans]|uniref:Pyridoxal 5'-phosphate synthase subunit PdxT n=1 Tax=Dehalogenimonas etheniformans TaxID=1536648 RepID=A0A2P5P9C0_9CHLR|nr:pyridoxal 5'-phosphate synthase glutaminase subunit PdxT [Dehalogenimonas etheniformans]PPD58887.1 pyridoxal 5'-phosphate synthase glutaminase subunit PdxT [Dehalogenimonas etheniformans]QNT76346.1 pyridoxal 5'-phosphate synthase glutaminase subunit PdxT [Dehalogenimonas etheniformans]
MKIGVLAMQGAFAEHIAILNSLGVEAVEVRRVDQFDELAGLIIPGGESTTMLKLGDIYNINEQIKSSASKGMPIWGTCAGAILLAAEVTNTGPNMPVGLGLMRMTVRRNAFGRQVDSFEVKLPVEGLGCEPFPAVFIRAPLIENVLPPAEVMARLGNGTIVAVRQGNMLATSFHPELSLDARFHRYFIGVAETYLAQKPN